MTVTVTMFINISNPQTEFLADNMPIKRQHGEYTCIRYYLFKP